MVADRGPRTSGELADALLAGPRRFKDSWLGQDSKTVVPLPMTSRMDGALAKRLCAGARELGVDQALVGRTGERHAGEELLRVALAEQDLIAGVPWTGDDYILCVPDLSGAVLVTTDGYCLLAGRTDFVRACVREGVDEARARFARYATKVASRYPGIDGVAGEFPPLRHSWSSQAEVDSGTGVAEQLALMESLVREDISPPAFEQAWLAARRRALNDGERTRDGLTETLDRVFYAIDDYVIDPDLREPGDLTDEQLVAIVRGALEDLRR